MVRERKHSEFGGGTGRIAPLPHVVTDSSHEQARMIFSTDTTDPQDTPEAALIRERAVEGRTGNESEIR